MTQQSRKGRLIEDSDILGCMSMKLNSDIEQTFPDSQCTN